jgi:hypothetical protein
MNSKALFEPWFRGPTWDGWRAVLKAAFALPMADDEAEFFHSIAERDPPKKRVRELWIIAGRRAGKDSIASLIAAHAASTFDQQHRLRPGERALVSCLAYDRDQAKIILDYTRGYFSESTLLKQLVEEDERASDFKLTNRVDIAVLTNSFRAVRGRPILLAVMDELAIWRDDTSQNPDVEVFNALVPGLASIGGMIVGISSPYRKNGLLWSKFKKHFGENSDDVLVVRAPTRVLNPTIPQEVIDAALAENPAVAKAEWLAEFRDDIGGYLSLEIVESAVDRGVTVRPPRDGIVYRSGVDPSGGSRDSFTAAVSHQEGSAVILDCVVEIKSPHNPATATEQIAQVLKSYGISETVGDRYAAQWVVDAFAKCGIKYRHSERDRSAIYADALPLFTSGRARLLDNPRLVGQFASLERTTSSLGRDKIDHGRGGSDDLCNAAALSMVLASLEKKPMFFSPPFLVSSPSYVDSFYTGAHVPAGSFDLGGSYQKPGGEETPENAARRAERTRKTESIMKGNEK